MATHAYHHGDLRRVMLAALADQITQSGIASVRLRELARRAGVSHTAPAHHFGDKTGLLTALATEGFELLAAVLDDSGTDIVDAGVGYIRFATTHPAHFEVMFDPALYRPDDPELLAAQEKANTLLSDRLRRRGGRAHRERASTAAWSIVHGFAHLWNSGLVDHEPGQTATEVGRATIAILFAER